jgi:hypothetical protein
MNKEYERVSDKELNGQHKCAACEITQQCICNIDFQKAEGMGDCSKGYHYKKVEK